MGFGVTRIAVTATALVVSAAGALGEDAAPYPVTDCSRLTTQMELNACAGVNLQAADAALNKLYRRVMAEADDAAAKEQLKDAERAWIAYRDKRCAYEAGPREEGGSIWPMEMSNCLEQKTAARIRELTKLRGCTAGASACHPH